MRRSFVTLVFLVPALLGSACKSFSETSEADAGTDVAEPPVTCPNGALEFEGKSFVKVAYDPAFNATSDLTVEAWILPDAASAADAAIEQDLVSHHDDHNSDGWVLMLKGGLSFRLYFGSGQGSYVDATEPSLTLGQWHHVAAVFDGGNKSIELFIDGHSNGRFIRSQTMASPYSGPLTFGAAAYLGANGFRGVIDEVRVSRKVVYTASFRPAYPLPDAEDGTIGTWHFPTTATTMDARANDVAKEASGRYTSTLATFDALSPTYPTAAPRVCPTGAGP